MFSPIFWLRTFAFLMLLRNRSTAPVTSPLCLPHVYSHYFSPLFFRFILPFILYFLPSCSIFSVMNLFFFTIIKHLKKRKNRGILPLLFHYFLCQHLFTAYQYLLRFLMISLLCRHRKILLFHIISVERSHRII